MSPEAITTTLINNFGAAGVLIAAIYLIAKKLATQYEARIAALEKASSVCEADRIELRNLIITHLTKK
jgi:hypothetical protein